MKVIFMREVTDDFRVEIHYDQAEGTYYVMLQGNPPSTPNKQYAIDAANEIAAALGFMNDY